jgi:hypothetical protein
MALLPRDIYKNQSKSVGVVCVTYRNPEKPSTVREFGLVALVEQMFTQNYDGNITLSIVDSSPTPHPFLDKVSQSHPDKLIYTHIPDRSAAPKQSTGFDFIPDNKIISAAMVALIKERYEDGKQIPQAMVNIAKSSDFSSVDEQDYDALIGRIPNTSFASENDIESLINDDNHDLTSLNTQFWAKRIQETMDIAGFVPFEDDYPIQTNIFSQIFGTRPAIGMKKNYGIQALVDKGFSPEAIVFSDDDDHHAPDYVAKSIAALGNNDFTRMTRYITHIFNAKDNTKDHEWGIFDLRIEKDSNGYWRLDQTQNQETLHRINPENGELYTLPMGKKFSRLVTMAWPILSHEGALHTYSIDAWKKSVDAFGGCAPVSFCEDIIYYRRNKDFFGNNFKDTHTPTDKGNETFIRVYDGTNSSVPEITEAMLAHNTPAWAQKSVKKYLVKQRSFIFT